MLFHLCLGARRAVCRGATGGCFSCLLRAPADATLDAAADTIPQLVRRRDLASGNLALNDSGDEIVLLSPTLLLADALAFGKGEYAVLGWRATCVPPAATHCNGCQGPASRRSGRAPALPCRATVAI